MLVAFPPGLLTVAGGRWTANGGRPCLANAEEYYNLPLGKAQSEHTLVVVLGQRFLCTGCGFKAEEAEIAEESRVFMVCYAVFAQFLVEPNNKKTLLFSAISASSAL
jgi:hypothetical protein